MELENESVTTLLGKGMEIAFEQVFKTHFKRLHTVPLLLLQKRNRRKRLFVGFFKLWDRNDPCPSAGL